MRISIRVTLAAIALAPALYAGEEQFDERLKYVREFKEDNRSVVCARVPEAPKLDGTFNDPLWKLAGRTQSAFTLFPSKEVCGRQSITLFCYDDKHIYIAFDCEEPELAEQQIDDKSVQGGDHIGVHFEVGSNGGRGPRCSLLANRGGVAFLGAWKEQKAVVKCVTGPKRWITQIAIPYKSFQGPGTVPINGEEWGLKLTRYGRNAGTGAARMRSGWPHNPAIVEDVTCYSASLFFGADSMLANGTLSAKDGVIANWQIAGQPALAAGKFSSREETVLTQAVKLRAHCKFLLEWKVPAGLNGQVSVKTDKGPVTAPLSAGRFTFSLAGSDLATVELRLSGEGTLPSLRLLRVIDDVPDEWICLTNNDLLPERNLKTRQPNAAEGKYIYLKCPLYAFDFAPYRSVGAPNPGQEMSWEWGTIGRPTRKVLQAPPAHPEIAEDELESFPFETLYQDVARLPEFVGLPIGSYDKGGEQGWIPFSKGSLTGDPSWAGWPVNAWLSGTANGQDISANTHDILFELPEKYFIRRIDILKITGGSFPHLDVYVRGSSSPEDTFVPIRKFAGATPYASLTDLDSVARQVRITFMGASFQSKFGRIHASTDLLGIAEIWIWAEPMGKHSDNDVKIFKPVIASAQQQPPLQCIQLRKLPEPIIWPRPKEMSRADGRFEVKPGALIAFSPEGLLPQVAGILQRELSQRFATELVLKDETQVGAAPGDGCIFIGMKGVSAKFDELCAAESLSVPAEPQGYGLKITPRRILAAGTDAEGVLHACQSLLQWMDHDELVAFARCATVRDWPLLRLRTVVPSTDHRQPILPIGLAESNFPRMIDALARLRFNSLLDWDPTRPYVSEAKTRELVQYAAERMVDLRPTLFLAQVPGTCIEINPDDQPTIGGIGGSDGTWETANLCPSNPLTYKEMEKYIDTALKTHDSSPYVEVGYLGCIHGQWNVCRLCRKRGLSGEELYADFLNKIGALCRARGKTAVFTNAIMTGDAIRIAGNKRASDAYDSINRAVGMRMDRPVAAQALVDSGFWTISRPWSTPRSVGAGGYSGGAGFFAGVPLDQPVEGAVSAGERCSYEGIWSWAFCGYLLSVANEFWNGPNPPRGKVTPKIYEEFEQTVANVNVRFHEQMTRGFEYPSWRTGMAPKFFTLDLKPFCTRSHIDEGTASGLGRSGPREGLIASGPAFDYRRVPTGKQEFANVPFEVIDPETNNWKSIVVVGDTQKQHLIPGSRQKVEIPIGRKAASFCALRCLLRKTNRIGDNRNWVHLILPAFVYEYADGTRYVCDRENIRQTDAINVPQCFQEGNDRGALQRIAALLGGSLFSFLWPAGRVAYCTNALSGGGATLFLNEFVNPYPEKEIKSVVIQLPNPEQKDFTFGFHEAIFGLTGVESVAWDEKFWTHLAERATRFPLLQANAELPKNAVPILSLCDYVPASDRPAWVSKDKKQPVASLRKAEGQSVWIMQFNQPQMLVAASFRLSMPWRDHGPMPVRFRHADVILSVSNDQKTWTEVARVDGCSGMDGEHRVSFVPTSASIIQIKLDSSKYVDEEASGIGLLSYEFYIASPKL